MRSGDETDESKKPGKCMDQLHRINDSLKPHNLETLPEVHK